MPTPDPDILRQLARYGVRVGVPESPAPVPAPLHVLPIEMAVPGATVANVHGSCYVSTVFRSADEIHGDERIAEARTTRTEDLAALVGRQWCAPVDPARTAFLDTETTGLAGGTGTYAFLIGIGRYRGDAFHVRQFFMRDPSEERAQLAEVAAWVEGCDGLVTFNGRSFDMPLLGTRYMLHRLPAPLSDAAHLDLLPAARRLWRRRLDSCALTSLERNVLALERIDDVPGWLIPERYVRYQRDGDARPLVGVFRHNALDVLSMLSLMARMARACARPETTLAHGQDWLALACVHETRGAWVEVVAACEGALRRGLSPPEADEARRRLANAARRRGDWARALEVWREMVNEAAPRRLFPFEALAKYHEHHARPPDLDEALRYAAHARDLVASGALRPSRGRPAAIDDLDHRIARLRRRLGARA